MPPCALQGRRCRNLANALAMLCSSGPLRVYIYDERHTTKDAAAMVGVRGYDRLAMNQAGSDKCQLKVGRLVGWAVGQLGSWVVGWLVGYLVGPGQGCVNQSQLKVGWFVGWTVGWLSGWLVGWLVERLGGWVVQGRSV